MTSLIRTPYTASALSAVALIGSIAFGHNGAATFATPLSNITIDGDLSDWPDSIKRHPIKNVEFGSAPESDEDLSGQFRVGYDSEKKLLYVVVEVTDSSRVYDDQPNRDWDTQDGCAIYIDRQQTKNGLKVEQYFQSGRDFKLLGAAQEEGNCQAGKVKIGESEGKRVYEWQVPLGEAGAGTTLGFDVDISDKDDDGSFTWAAWGSGTQKAYSIGHLGHLHLVADDDAMELVRVTGTVHMEKSSEDGQFEFPGVSIQSTTCPSLWTLILCDESGRYSTELPAGSYRVNAVDGSGLRVDESVSNEFKLEAGEHTEAELLTVSPPECPSVNYDAKLLRKSEFDSNKVDEFVAAFQEYHRIPGLSLAIIADGKVCYSKKYGVKNAVTKAALEADTVFEACSLTKPIFAFAVNRLVEKGVLDFQTPLYKYKPRVSGYEDVADDPRYRQITAQHVLAHRTGFPNWRSDKLTIDFEPGKGYGYSGEGFELLGAIVSHLTGKPLVEVIDEEVFTPLGIENAHLVWNDVLAERTANGHILGIGPVPKTRNYQPGMAYSLHIDAENYAKLLIAILNRQGLEKETYDNMLSQQFEIADPDNPHEFPYGLGLIVEDTPHGKKYSHTGVNTGWRCRFGIYDDLKLGYVDFTNSDSGAQFGEDLEKFLITGRPDQNDGN